MKQKRWRGVSLVWPLHLLAHQVEISRRADAVMHTQSEPVVDGHMPCGRSPNWSCREKRASRQGKAHYRPSGHNWDEHFIPTLLAAKKTRPT